MNASVTAYGFLAAAIGCEVAGTTLLQRSEQFSRLLPGVGTVLFYALSFYCLSHALKVLPLGIAYAIWSGVGIVVTASIGVALFRQSLDLPALVGIGLIIAGVVVINAFSQSSVH